MGRTGLVRLAGLAAFLSFVIAAFGGLLFSLSASPLLNWWPCRLHSSLFILSFVIAAFGGLLLSLSASPLLSWRRSRLHSSLVIAAFGGYAAPAKPLADGDIESKPHHVVV